MAICTLSQNPARRFGCIERAGKARGHDDENRDIDLSCILRSSSFPRSPRGSSPAGSSRWSCRWASVWRRTRGRSKMIAGRWNVERRQVRTNVGGRSSAMFAAKAAGRAVMKPKLGLHASNGTLFLASAGAFWTRQLTAASSGSASPATTSGTCLISRGDGLVLLNRRLDGYAGRGDGRALDYRRAHRGRSPSSRRGGWRGPMRCRSASSPAACRCAPISRRSGPAIRSRVFARRIGQVLAL